MNTAKTLNVSTTSSEATKVIGQNLAKLMVGSEVVELIGDLGSGKTTLVKGMLEGLGYSGEAPSPTFTLSRVYKLDQKLELHHYDLYRLNGHDLVGDELAEAAGAVGIITVVEWANHGAVKLPADRLKLTLNHAERENDRQIMLQASGPQSERLLKGCTDVLSA